MKYKIFVWLLVICLFCAFPAMATDLTVLLDGWDISMPELVIEYGVPRLPNRGEAISPNMPINKNGILYMSSRKLADLLGAEVTYTDGNIRMLKDSKVLNMKANSKTATLQAGSAKPEALQVVSPAYIENGQSYLPMRFVAEALGCNVNYDLPSNTVSVVTGEPLTIDGKKLCYATAYNFFSMKYRLYGYYGYANVGKAYQILQDGKVREIEAIYEPSCNLDWQFQFYESKPVYEVGNGVNPENYVIKYKLYTYMFYEPDSSDSQFMLYDETEDKWYEFASDPRYFCKLLNNEVLLDYGGA